MSVDEWMSVTKQMSVDEWMSVTKQHRIGGQ